MASASNWVAAASVPLLLLLLLPLPALTKAAEKASAKSGISCCCSAARTAASFRLHCIASWLPLLLALPAAEARASMGHRRRRQPTPLTACKAAVPAAHCMQRIGSGASV